MTRRWSTVGALLLCAPAAGLAQRTTASLDLGTARMRYADSLEANAMSASLSLQHHTSRISLEGSGTMSRLDDAWSNSGNAAATFASRFGRRLTGELVTTAGGSAHSDGARTGQFLGAVRLRIDGSSRGAWIGGGVGRAWDGVWRATRQGESGVWLAAGPMTAMMSATPTVVGDTIRYTDASASLQRGAANWDAGASLSVRIGNPIPSLPTNRKVWGALSVTRWMSPSVGVEAAVGTYPVDFTQGFPGGQYVSLSLRLSPSRRSGIDVSLAGRAAAVESDVRAFRTEKVSGGEYRISVFAPGASTAEVTGDFTLWKPRHLNRSAGGWFEVTVPIGAGTHQLNVRLDGGAWVVPPGLTRLLDEFGGSVGLLDVR